MLALTDFPWTETNLSFQSMWGGGPANLWENCCVKGSGVRMACSDVHPTVKRKSGYLWESILAVCSLNLHPKAL